MANFKTNTRYTNGELFSTDAEQQFLILRRPLNLLPNADDVLITINQDLQYRWDLISYKAYNTIDLWWVIAEFNGISDPFFELKIGQTLSIPAIERVLEAINNLGKE